jgi:eukaryotic-like serine/threonine-protein kinase
MPITGTRLGSYEVVAQIGAGGMGEVYKAHDTKLGRDVAVKVLPQAFAHDADRLARFQREAKVLASLNHSNIATIHGLEQSNGTNYLVMELVQGETLAERIKRDGALPVEEALKIAAQIAEALEAAHEKGIIHRDLKPANVKVTPEGKVKVLDFGLAKAFAGDVADSNPSQSPTLSAVATMQGVLLGTAAYMSPEQARGKAVDKRTDIWAFGCVLYELLTGKQAFQGEDITEILAAVVKTEPDWNGLPECTPPAIPTLLRRCLRKDRNQRLRDAADARIEIEDVLSTPNLGPINAVPTATVWRRPPVVGLVAFLAGIVIAAVAAGVWYRRPSVPQTVQTPMRFAFSMPPNTRMPEGAGNHLDLSPDGTHVAYLGIREDGSSQLYLQQVGSLEAKPIAGTEGASVPVFSPDGQWLAFRSSGKLKKVPTAGGDPLTLCDLQNPRGVNWGRDGTIVFTDVASPGIWQVPAAGGTPKLLVAADTSKAESFYWPELLPGGNAVLFAVGEEFDWGDEQIAVQDLATGKRRVLVEGATYPRLLPNGYLLYVRDRTLMAAVFDPVSLQFTTAAVPALGGVAQGLSSGVAYYGVAANGSFVYVPAGSWEQGRTLVWQDRKGSVQPIASPGVYLFPSLSPDGKRLATAVEGGRNQIWLYDISGERFTRLTFENGNRSPVWSSDGSRVAYASMRGGSHDISWRHVDGTGAEESLTRGGGRLFPNSFSPDGRMLAFTQWDPKTGYDIWLLPLDGERKPRPFLQTPAFEGGAMFSPDGHWLAYTSDETGRYEVYVQPFEGPGGKWQVSTEGGQQPRWAHSGRELFYLGLDQGKVMAVDLTTQPTFSAGKPRLVSQTQGIGGIAPPMASNYDVSPDGQHFLRVKSADWTQLPTQIIVVLNWFEELKQKVPPGKK